MNTATRKVTIYIDGVLRLQDKYGWMMDSYVLDFFTENLWDKLPRKWADALTELKPQEISYFFLEMYSCTKFKWHSPKPKFRKVWPLELLAFIASCHALKLDYQTWVKINKKQNTRAKNRVFEDRKTDHQKFDGKVMQDGGSVTGIQGQEETDTQLLIDDTLKEQQILQLGPQNLNLSYPFRCHIKPKKQYEIEVLSKVICEQTEKLQCWNIVDVGAGLGHLSRLLSYGCKLRVVTIEGDGCHKTGVEKIDNKVLTHLRKEEPLNKVDGTADGLLVHITHHINADISSEEFSKIVLQAFSSMKKNTDSSKRTNDSVDSKQRKPLDNFIIVGLHTCGDLSSTLLRVFNHCESAVGIISMGCCYMKLSHETARTDQRTQRTCNELNHVYSTGICSNTQQKCIKLRRNDKEFTDQIESTGSKNSQASTIQMVDSEMETVDLEDKKIVGYPLSDYLKSCSNHRQTYNALESACHAIERYHKKLLELSPTLKLHFYRASLELLLKQKNPDSPRRQIRRLRTKKAAKMSLTEYVTSACDILAIEDGRPTAQDIQIFENLHGGKEFNVVVFYVLRLLLAPVIEGLLMADRLIYIREQQADFSSRISMLFDPEISPRNFAIIADKHPLHI